MKMLLDFDFNNFKTDLIMATENVFLEIINKYQDIYAFSLSFSSNLMNIGVFANTLKGLDKKMKEDPENIWYYKFCEEEWEINEDQSPNFQKIKQNLINYLQSHEITDENYIYTDLFIAFRNKIFKTCVEALLTLKRRGIFLDNIIINFYVREYFNGEEAIDIFKTLNEKDNISDFIEYIDEFI